jgi:Tol biopolymer transport system component
MQRPHAARSSLTGIRLFRVVILAACLVLASAQVALSASPIQQLTNDAAADVRPVWSLDGSKVAFQSNRGGKLYQVYVMDADGANERRVSAEGVDDRHPSWSPTGTALAVDSGSESVREIWTVDLATGARTQVTKLGTIATFPSWSPDGKQLSFYSYRGGVLDLWAVGVDGSNPKQLTRGLASEQQQQCTFACHAAPFSPDGNRLAYATTGRSEVWTMRASDGGDAQRVSPEADASGSHFPIYLADGRLLYVTEHVTPGQAWTDVWSVRPDGSEPRQPVMQDVQAQGPFAISADGQWLLFASPRGGNFDIYRVPINDEGKDAMKVRSGETEPAPSLHAKLAGQAGSQAGAQAAAPAAGPSGQAGNAQVISTPPSLTAPPGALSETSQPSPSAAPYLLLAAGGLVALWLAVEGVRWSRRRSRLRARR